MTQPSEAFDSYDSIGTREDLTDVIYNIAPIQTPFLSMSGRAKAEQTLHEWQTDDLASVDASNAVIDGDDATHDAVAPTVREVNRTQISDKVIVITGTQEVVNKAGRKSEMAYQIAKKSKELKRDMEAILTGTQNILTGDSSTARLTRALESWLETNIIHGATGSTTAGVVTDGTQIPLTEALMKTVLQECWTEGGDPRTLMCGPFNKSAISAFDGIATLFRDTAPSNKQASIMGAADVYVSDWGELQVIPNRFSRDRTLLILDMDMWAVAYLRPFRVQPLSKTGDSERRQLIVEYALEGRNEKASGKVADVDDS
jgi:hypothetical protein